MDGEGAVLIDCESGFVAAFGESDGTEVADDAVSRRFKLPQMGVPINEDVVTADGEVFLIIYMPVREEKAHALIHKEGIVGHDGKLKEHLIDLGVAVATHGNNAVLHGIEAFDDAFRVDAFGYSVARTVVEDVAKDAEHVAMLLLIETECLLKGGQTAVDVG